ncbi:hypothetical protein P7K49_019864 [Saguinus oedipus]|uniref:Uncharacterized protein n=1 Tax=Saguinus oedipus TaxID=9490 RepID=A0ABQ9UYM0_SAGOE|nr:hypothetical protein P7K49_019864 [Saguinus oedipus]
MTDLAEEMVVAQVTQRPPEKVPRFFGPGCLKTAPLPAPSEGQAREDSALLPPPSLPPPALRLPPSESGLCGRQGLHWQFWREKPPVEVRVPSPGLAGTMCPDPKSQMVYRIRSRTLASLLGIHRASAVDQDLAWLCGVHGVSMLLNTENYCVHTGSTASPHNLAFTPQPPPSPSSMEVSTREIDGEGIEGHAGDRQAGCSRQRKDNGPETRVVDEGGTDQMLEGCPSTGNLHNICREEKTEHFSLAEKLELNWKIKTSQFKLATMAAGQMSEAMDQPAASPGNPRPGEGGDGSMEPGTCQELLHRLRELEAENSALAQANENQRETYERCLDEVANHVVQALLNQKVSNHRRHSHPHPHPHPSQAQTPWGEALGTADESLPGE